MATNLQKKAKKHFIFCTLATLIYTDNGVDTLHFLTASQWAKMGAQSFHLTEAEWVTMQITTIGLYVAKTEFHLFTVNRAGTFVKKKQLKRRQLLVYIAQLEPCLVVMEACGGANHWARKFITFGHEVKLIAQQYVKPSVKGNKNDYNDAGAVVEAAQRPSMRFVPIKSIEQQDVQNFHRQRERIKKERQAMVNQMRGVLAEYGIVIPIGVTSLHRQLPLILEDTDNGLTCYHDNCLPSFLKNYRQLVNALLNACGA
ncbi:MAG: hypothetical protein ACJATV_001274 [Granulosicoccus sp.]